MRVRPVIFCSATQPSEAAKFAGALTSNEEDLIGVCREWDFGVQKTDVARVSMVGDDVNVRDTQAGRGGLA